MSEANQGISRRTLVKGTAWAVPAVAVASAAPAMAKSGRGPVLDVQRACKQPGSSCANTNRPYNFVKGYTFTASIYNPSGETIYVYTSTPATPPGAYDPRFQVTSAVPFTYASARYFTPNLTPPYSGIGAPWTRTSRSRRVKRSTSSSTPAPTTTVPTSPPPAHCSLPGGTSPPRARIPTISTPQCLRH